MEKLRNLVSEGKTKKALQELLEYSKGNRPDLIDDILIISAGYNELQRKNSIGILSSTDYQIEVNKINLSLLKYINSIEKEEKLNIPAKKKQKRKPPKWHQRNFWISIGVVIAILSGILGTIDDWWSTGERLTQNDSFFENNKSSIPIELNCDTIFNNNKLFNILILPFNSYDKSIDRNIEKALNTHFNELDNEFESIFIDCLEELSEPRIAKFANDSKADLVIFGSKEDKEAILKYYFFPEYRVNPVLKFKNLMNKESISFESFLQIENGGITGNLNFINFLVQGLNQSNLNDHLTSIQSNKKALEFANSNIDSSIVYQRIATENKLLSNLDSCKFYLLKSILANSQNEFSINNVAYLYHHHEKKYEIALQYYLKSLNIKANPYTLANIATLLSNNLNKKEEAIKYLKELIEFEGVQDFQDENGNSLLYVSLYSLGDYYWNDSPDFIKAEKYFLRAEGVNPNIEIFKTLWSFYYTSAKDKGKAEKYCELAFQLNNSDLSLLQNLVIIKYENGKYNESISLYKELIRLSPESRDNRFERLLNSK